MESSRNIQDNFPGSFENKSTIGYKLVPWLNWHEWDFVRESFFSSSPKSIASALTRISAWRSRGCLPVVIEVTASIIEIQQQDPFFRVDHAVNSLHSEEMLAMLYCMAIMRFVNGVVEKTRKISEVSIADAADMIGIPRMLIDIRHEGSHRDLPSLRLLRIASVKALDWLKSYYWEPQRSKAAFQEDGTPKIRKEIKSKLHELLLCLNLKTNSGSSPSQVIGKRYNKKIMKLKKDLLQLYSSFSSELVSVLLEYLLKVSDSLDMVESPKHSQNDPCLGKSQTVPNDWKLVITKLSKKEPKLQVALLLAVLDMIQTQNANEDENGEHRLLALDYKSEKQEIEHLSSLFAWLVGIHKVLKPHHKKGSPPKNQEYSDITFASGATLTDLIHKSLLVSAPCNTRLMSSILLLAKHTRNNYLVKNLNKFSFLVSSYTDTTNENPIELMSEETLQQENDILSQTAKTLEMLKSRKRKIILSNTETNCDIGKFNRWVISKSWSACPIGMLPAIAGSSGRLPALDCCHDYDRKEVTEKTERRELLELNQCGKREARCDIELLDNLGTKKMRKTGELCETEGVEGRLMINGVWRNVREEELIAIKSAIRILV